MVPQPKLARLLATEPLLAAALTAPGSAVNLQCASQSCLQDLLIREAPGLVVHCKPWGL